MVLETAVTSLLLLTVYFSNYPSNKTPILLSLVQLVKREREKKVVVLQIVDFKILPSRKQIKTH